MASTDRACSQLREYLCRRNPFPDKDSSPGRQVMESYLKTYFWWKGSLGDMARNLGVNRNGSKSRPVTSTSTSSSSSNSRRPTGQPEYKRRRVRGGSVAASVSRPTTIAGTSKKGGKDVEEEVKAGGELEEEAGEIADL